MRHTVAWYQDAAGSDGEFAAINAVTDGVIFSEGKDIRVPSDLAMLAGWAAVNNNDQAGVSRITSPMLRRRSNLYMERVDDDGSIGNLHPYLQAVDQPIRLNPEESLRFERVAATVAGTASIGVAELCDAAMQPVMGDLIAWQCTAAIAGAAGAWHNGTITPAERLPTGWYDIVGATVIGTNGIAFRLQLPGFPYRPGGLVRAGATVSPGEKTQFGRAGRWGRFHTNQPFSIDVLGIGALSGTYTAYLQLLAA